MKMKRFSLEQIIGVLKLARVASVGCKCAL